MQMYMNSYACYYTHSCMYICMFICMHMHNFMQCTCRFNVKNEYAYADIILFLCIKNAHAYECIIHIIMQYMNMHVQTQC